MGILDTLAAALAGNAKGATDSMAASPSTAGLVKARRDMAATADEDVDTLRNRQHADSAGNHNVENSKPIPRYYADNTKEYVTYKK